MDLTAPSTTLGEYWALLGEYWALLGEYWAPLGEYWAPLGEGFRVLGLVVIMGAVSCFLFRFLFYLHPSCRCYLLDATSIGCIVNDHFAIC